MEHCHILHLVQRYLFYLAAVLRGDGIAGHIAAGCGSRVGDNGGETISDGIIVHILCVVSLPVHRGEIERPPVLGGGFGDVLQIHTAEVGIGAGRGYRPRVVFISGRFYGDGASVQFQRAGETVLGSDGLGIRQQRQNGGQFFAFTADRHGFGIFLGLLFG